MRAGESQEFSVPGECSSNIIVKNYYVMQVLHNIINQGGILFDIGCHSSITGCRITRGVSLNLWDMCDPPFNLQSWCEMCFFCIWQLGGVVIKCIKISTTFKNVD